jgi:segregation and condensation protein B
MSSEKLNLEHSDAEEPTEDEVGLSLEELSQTYSSVLAKGELPYQADETANAPAEESAPESFDPLEEALHESDACPVTPQSILEAIVFVGRPDNGAITAAEIASLMRGVREEEIESLVSELNQIYAETGRATRIVQSPTGFLLQLSEDLQHIKDRFYGQVRETRLNQAAIDCLALVSYQPGISREKLEQQRGQPSGGVLNQLVRRQLLEIRREPANGKISPHYYPTERLMQLAGLSSLDDLPQAEDLDG